MWNLYLILSCTLAPCKYHITAYHCLLLELCTWIWNMRGITELEHTYLEVKVSRVVYEISAGSLVWYHMCTHLFPSSSDNGQTCHLQNNDSVRYECTTTCHLQILVRNVGAIACCVGTSPKSCLKWSQTSVLEGCSPAEFIILPHLTHLIQIKSSANYQGLHELNFRALSKNKAISPWRACITVISSQCS